LKRARPCLRRLRPPNPEMGDASPPPDMQFVAA
jgi:hypothetical protein